MLTVHKVHKGADDTIQRERKRPRPTSSNFDVVGKVFEDNPSLWLYIPLFVDDYNHHMNGVDVANLHRAHLSTQRGRCLRNWRPHFSFLLNVSLVNCYILWRFQALQKDSKVRWTVRSFAKHLAAALMVYKYPEEVPASVKIAATSRSTGGRPKGILLRHVTPHPIRTSVSLSTLDSSFPHP
jgi:hypothetical protein